MKQIGITQRVEVFPDHYERRDCLDQGWTALFERLDCDLLPIPNNHSDIVSWAKRKQLDGLVLSGGNDLAHLPSAQHIAPERDTTEQALLDWASKVMIPVLGVCRGMQMLNVWLGGKLEPVVGHVACRHLVWPCENIQLSYAELFGYYEVNSFHNWCITPSGLAVNLVPYVKASDGSIEAFMHATLPWVGVMWHPERNNEDSTALDLALLQYLFNQETRIKNQE